MATIRNPGRFAVDLPGGFTVPGNGTITVDNDTLRRLDRSISGRVLAGELVTAFDPEDDIAAPAIEPAAPVADDPAPAPAKSGKA